MRSGIPGKVLKRQVKTFIGRDDLNMGRNVRGARISTNFNGLKKMSLESIIVRVLKTKDKLIILG